MKWRIFSLQIKRTIIHSASVGELYQQSQKIRQFWFSERMWVQFIRLFNHWNDLSLHLLWGSQHFPCSVRSHAVVVHKDLPTFPVLFRLLLEHFTFFHKCRRANEWMNAGWVDSSRHLEYSRVRTLSRRMQKGAGEVVEVPSFLLDRINNHSAILPGYHIIPKVTICGVWWNIYSLLYFIPYVL